MKLTKYRNRKLYSRDQAALVKVDEVIKAIREGRQVQIICHRTKLDITRDVLKQVLPTLDPSMESMLRMIREAA
jgi:polyhydroxyalkanoate synthesis regulator protein